MVYMSISVSAAGTFDSQSYYIAFRKNTTSGSWKSATAGNFPYTLTSANSTINSYVFLGYKTNQVIADESIIVATIKVDNIEGITLLGAGQPTSATLFTQTGITYAEMMDIPLTQEVIASTSIQLGDAIQHTVTFKAKGYTSQNAVIGYWLGAIATSGSAITLVNCDLYESIQEAASSGATPEEMREVLSEWTEEELGPVIKDNVQEGVQAGMEEALENEKEQAHGGASGSIDDVTGALEGVTADMEEITQQVEEFIRSFAYQGTSAVITFPALDVPVLGHISDAITIDMAQKATEMIPSALLLMLRVATSLGLVLFPVWQTIKLFKELFDVYEGY